MNLDRYLSINQLSKIYNLPDITLFRDFKKLLRSNKGTEGKDYIKYYKDPRQHKFEWRIDPVWFENNVERKLRIYVEHDTSADDLLGSTRYSTERSYSPQEQHAAKPDPEPVQEEGTEGIRSWLMAKIDELTEMLKNSQVLIAQKDKQIESLQKKVLQIEQPIYTTAETPVSTAVSYEDTNETDTAQPDENTVIQTVTDEVTDTVPDEELHENIQPYDLNEHDHNELLTSLSTLENIVTDDGDIDTTEIERDRDIDPDAWEQENEYVVPDNPNVRGGETDPRVLDSDNEPITSGYTDEDAFTRIARDRGY